MQPEEAFRQAVDAVGGQSAMGRLLDVSQTSVWRWIHKNRALPAEHVLTVEEVTAIPRHVLRPDIYPRETPASTSSANVTPRHSSGHADDGDGASIHDQRLMTPRGVNGSCDRSAILQAEGSAT